MVGMVEAQVWAVESESVFARVAGRFGRANPRWRMRDYLRGPLAPVVRKNGWRLAEYAGHRTPDGFQRLLNSSVWDADVLRDNVREYVVGKLGPGGVLIVDDTGSSRRAAPRRGWAGSTHVREDLPDFPRGRGDDEAFDPTRFAQMGLPPRARG
jgi:hypothetical protein